MGAARQGSGHQPAHLAAAQIKNGEQDPPCLLEPEIYPRFGIEGIGIDLLEDIVDRRCGCYADGTVHGHAPPIVHIRQLVVVDPARFHRRVAVLIGAA